MNIKVANAAWIGLRSFLWAVAAAVPTGGRA